MEEAQILKNRGLSVKDAWDCFRNTESSKYFPGLIMVILREEAWRDRIVAQTQRRQTFRTFREFVSAEGPEGLGIPMSTIAKICRETGRHDVLLAIEEVDKREPGRPIKSELIGGVATNYCEKRIDRKSSGKLLSRLKREQPALLDDVLSGNKTINAACVEAGFRRKEYRLPQDPEAAAAYLLKRVNKQWIAQFVDALNDHEA